ncbi:MAG: hypothetical protein CM1200mP30_26490 [Pseudomonadota bacterium]|nr:MAG: hypothetical protein CM1200mP30_26490 [Pseudomonadota bacterium]
MVKFGFKEDEAGDLLADIRKKKIRTWWFSFLMEGSVLIKNMLKE